MAFFNIQFIVQNTATTKCLPTMPWKSFTVLLLESNLNLDAPFKQEKSGNDPEQCISSQQQDLPAPSDARTERATHYEAWCNQGGPWQAEPGPDEPACHRRAPGLCKLINHQGGVRGVHSLQPSISTPGGEAITSPFPCAAILHPQPSTSATVFDSQISRSRYWLARHSMVWKVTGGSNHIKYDKRAKGAFMLFIRAFFF